MIRTAVPEILDQIARAEAAGVSIPSSPQIIDEIHLCRQWGHAVECRNGSMWLPANPDALVPAWIERDTPALCWERLQVAGYFELGSTNEEALVRLRKGNTPEGLLIFTESQTAGKGRHGRIWHASPGKGLCFSFVVKPLRPHRQWTILTHAAAAALARALRDLSVDFSLERELAIELKWPNDVLISGRKAAGILLECVRAWGGDMAAVIGIGINVGKESVPISLRETATSVNDEAGFAVPRRWLLTKFLMHFQLLYGLFQDGNDHAILEAWKSCSSMWNGTDVSILENQRERTAVTCGLTETGGLKIINSEGKAEVILAADVSIRTSSPCKER